ncbi:3-deoxy-D-manno-octulosonic acid transferase [Pseudoruegeria sp. SK021]|uniref:3-deoxy-D-manno-octulosonic acid transferase n=1 Tax=Pseudoruegeria sp. SK021 TaxID=1933035 RepID=UPI000A252B34|nr:3-deoxy-D-manno-octulosonic acid transferase [Pseudoruegeria sp. SK021]OSP55071.1 3-deoxy-D-manno-octulosonic acid transferase [Pseudoruegeria sp. SK021]
MPRSLALSAYLAFSSRAERRGRRLLETRLAAGKEDPLRIGERRGEPSLPRPDGPLIWFHAASVGESLSLLEVIKRLSESDNNLHFLITTGTVTSASILAARLPDRCLHQFVPIDVRDYVRRFLDHWQPDLAVWTESEFWPSLILETDARGTPLLLLNARMSANSVKRWRWLGNASKALLGTFRAVQAQDDASAAFLRSLGVAADRITVTGSLKEGTPPPPCDEAERVRLTKCLATRMVWAATSTHPGEEDIVAEAHDLARQASLRLLLILAPRHAERGTELADMLRKRGMVVAQRSKQEIPSEDTQIYLADTMGELGLWYRLAPVSFVGGSLVDIGGHNPFEPAALGSAILHGPHVQNFADIYDRLDLAGAALPVAGAKALAHAVTEMMQPDKRAPMAYAAWEVSSSGADATDKALALIQQYLPAPRRPATSIGATR